MPRHDTFNDMNRKVNAMMKPAMIMVVALGLTCVPDVPAGENQAQAAAAASASGGYFDGVVGNHAYLVNISCSDLEQDYFRFLSDRTDAADSNGDGVIISGVQNGGEFALTIVDNGETYSTGRLENFSKNPNGATGSGTLHQDNSTLRFEGHFSVVCQR